MDYPYFQSQIDKNGKLYYIVISKYLSSEFDDYIDLLFSCGNNDIENVKRLLELEIIPDIRCYDIAAYNGCNEVLVELLKEENIELLKKLSERDYEYFNEQIPRLSSFPALMNNIETIKITVEKFCQIDLLRIGIFNNNLEIVKLSLTKTVDLFDDTPIILANDKSYLETWKSAIEMIEKGTEIYDEIRNYISKNYFLNSFNEDIERLILE